MEETVGIGESAVCNGRIEQAVEEYRQVIEPQQPLIGVRLQLGKLLQLMGREVEAVAVYESALANARNEATRQHISGSIALCRGDTQAAILAFESAASLEPDNAANWLALGQVQMGDGVRLQLCDRSIGFCH
jgi:Flp pilus assembly protein TadD